MLCHRTTEICQYVANVICEKDIPNEIVFDLGECLSAKSCGLIEKHPTEKGERRKLQCEIAILRKNLNNTQDNYKMKSTSYAKITNSFVHKVESDLITNNHGRS